MPDLIEVPYEPAPKEELDLKPERKTVRKVEYEVEKREVSPNIAKFDRKVKVHTENPYSFNAVVKKQQASVPPTQTATQMITNPQYNVIGKFLGVDTVHDWNRYYDKVYTIVEWAKVKSGTDNLHKLMSWISHKSRTVPSVGNRRIDDLYLFAKLHFAK